MILHGVHGRVEQNFPLKALNTWRVGGSAETVFWPESEEELQEAKLQAQIEGVPIRLIGRGSNLLFPDEGLSGITLVSTSLDKVAWDKECVRVGAGYSLARLAQEAGNRALAGLEFARGIPGTVGGAIVMNAGAHGGEIQAILEQVRVLTAEGELQSLSRDEIQFAYRECSLRGKAWVLEGVFRLKPGERESMQGVMQENLAKRKMAQPLELPNAGSVFRNPPGNSAGRLIEQAGWKGKTMGGAQVSTKHANFIVNIGNATAHDVLSLIREIKKDVYQKFEVELKTEVQYITPN